MLDAYFTIILPVACAAIFVVFDLFFRKPEVPSSRYFHFSLGLLPILFFTGYIILSGNFEKEDGFLEVLTIWTLLSLPYLLIALIAAISFKINSLSFHRFSFREALPSVLVYGFLFWLAIIYYRLFEGLANI